MTKKKKRKKTEQTARNKTSATKLLNPKKETRIFNIVSLLFLFLGFLLYYNQFVTLEKLFNKVSVFANWGTLGQFIQFLDKYSHHIFDSTDKLVWWLIVSIFGLIILMEITKNWLSIFFEKIFKKERNIIIFLVLFFAVMLRFYIAKGEDMAYGDGPFHLAHIWYAFKGFQAGKIFPYWTTIFSCGSLVIWPYSPMYPLIYGFIAYLTGNFFFGVKLAFLLTQLMGAIGIYLWLKEYTGNKKAAMIGSIGYGLCFEFIVIMIYPGRYPAGLIIGIIPYILYCSEKIIKNFANVKFLIILIILIALMPLSHFAMGLWMLIFWSIYITLRIFLLKNSFKNNLKRYSLILLAVFVAILLTTFFILPTLNGFDGWNWIGNRFLTNYEQGIKFPNEVTPYINKLLLWNNTHFSLFSSIKGKWDIGYIGLSLFILSLLGIYYILKNKYYKFLPLIIIYLFNLYILIFYHIKLSSYIPFLYINGSSRYLLYLIIPLVSLSSIAFLFLIDKLKIRAIKIFSFLFLILLLDLGTTTFQDTYALKYRGQSVSLFQWMKTNFPETPEYRVISLGKRNGPVKATSREESVFPLYSNLASPNQVIRGTVMISDIFINRFIKAWIFNSTSHQGEISDLQLKALSLINTKLIASDMILKNKNLKVLYSDRYTVLYENTLYSPILKANNIIKITNQKFDLSLSSTKGWIVSIDGKNISNLQKYEYIKKIIMDYNINSELNECDKLFIRNNITPINIKKFNLSNKTKFKLLEHKITYSDVILKIKSSGNCILRLPYTFYPHLIIKNNDKKIDKYCTLGYMMAIKINKGINNITIKPSLSSKQKGLLYFEIFIVFILIFLLIIRKKVNIKINNYLQ